MKFLSCDLSVLYVKLAIYVALLASLITLITFYFDADLGFDDPNSKKFEKQKTLTAEELLGFKGLDEANGNKLYLGILGKVYDVTKGGKHYGPGAQYHVFTGRDVSRAFVTGEFAEEKLTDAVLDLSFSDLKSLRDWSNFYKKQYPFVGLLVGRFYDGNGTPTPYLIALEDRFSEADKIDGNQVRMKQMFPPCNVEWDSEKGTRVWCSQKSGGIIRDWIGVPRKLYEPGVKGPRCACVSDERRNQGNIEEYDDCLSDSDSCYISNQN